MAELKRTLDKIKSLSDYLKSFLYIIATIAALCSGIYLSVDAALDKKMEGYNMGLRQEVETLKNFVVDEITTNINAVYERITNSEQNPPTKAQVEKIIKYYHVIENPNPDIAFKYLAIVEYYTSEIMGGK